jgi:hypothetical protein
MDFSVPAHGARVVFGTAAQQQPSRLTLSSTVPSAIDGVRRSARTTKTNAGRGHNRDRQR